MYGEERIEIKKPEGHKCFACGTANPIGLNMQFYRLGDSICSDITLGRHYTGWANISHGGIISTLLDETMSWTILYFKRIFFMTRKMEVKYIAPVSVGTHLTIKGYLSDSMRPNNIIKAKAEIRDDHGKLLAKGTGEFVTLDEKALPPVLDGSKEEIFSLIEKFSHQEEK